MHTIVMYRTGAKYRTSESNRQRGVALITVLLVFVLVAVIATEMLRRSQLSLRSVGNLIETRQAYYYALGGEAYARQVLAKDIIDGHGDTDTLNEPWAQTKDQQPLEIDNGSMQIEINDLQGRFNLNSVTDPVGIDHFKRLLQALQLNPNCASEWQRWISTTSQQQSGDENSDSAAVLTAGQPEADISALRLLHSMQPQDYAKLAPHVAVLPSDRDSGPPKININTAEDVVLQAIMSPTLSAQIVAKQKSGGYTHVADAGVDESVAAVNSKFFEVVVTVNYANRWQRVRTVLQREHVTTSDQVKFTVISRVRSPLIDDLEF